MNKVRDLDMQSALKALEREFQHGEFCNVQLDPVVRSCDHRTVQFDRQRNELVQGAIEPDLITVSKKRDPGERRTCDAACVEEVPRSPYWRGSRRF